MMTFGCFCSILSVTFNFYMLYFFFTVSIPLKPSINSMNTLLIKLIKSVLIKLLEGYEHTFD